MWTKPTATRESSPEEQAAASTWKSAPSATSPSLTAASFF
jgi:hypothetical protein